MWLIWEVGGGHPKEYKKHNIILLYIWPNLTGQKFWNPKYSKPYKCWEPTWESKSSGCSRNFYFKCSKWSYAALYLSQFLVFRKVSFFHSFICLVASIGFAIRVCMMFMIYLLSLSIQQIFIYLVAFKSKDSARTRQVCNLFFYIIKVQQ